MKVSRWFYPDVERASHSMVLVVGLDLQDPQDELLPAKFSEPRM